MRFVRKNGESECILRRKGFLHAQSASGLCVSYAKTENRSAFCVGRLRASFMRKVQADCAFRTQKRRIIRRACFMRKVQADCAFCTQKGKSAVWVGRGKGRAGGKTGEGEGEGKGRERRREKKKNPNCRQTSKPFVLVLCCGSVVSKATVAVTKGPRFKTPACQIRKMLRLS